MSDKTPAVLRHWKIDAVAAAACVALSLAIYLTLVRPAAKHRAENEQLRSQISEKTQAVRQARASLSALRKQFSDAEVSLEALPLRLESARQINHRLAKLADLASKAGIELHQMKPQTPRAGTRYDVVPISLAGSGDYRRVTLFLRRLHEGFTDVAVVGFDLTSQTPGSSSAVFDLDLVWYAMPAMGFVQE